MVWETVKKEMTITKALLLVVAVLLCCFLAFGLPHGSQRDEANNEKGIDMLNLFREYLEKNESQPENTQPIYNTTPSKPRKFYSVSPKPDSQSRNVVNSNNKPKTSSFQSTNTSGNSSVSELDIIVVEVNEQPQQEDSGVLDIEKTGTRHVDKIAMNHVLFSKTVRITKVEEVFEDLVSQNVRRIIKEDRAERIEVSRNNEMETVGSELGIKDLLSL